MQLAERLSGVDDRTAYFQNGSLQLVIVPEPGAFALAGLGVAVAAWACRRRARRM